MVAHLEAAVTPYGEDGASSDLTQTAAAVAVPIAVGAVTESHSSVTSAGQVITGSTIKVTVIV